MSKFCCPKCNSQLEEIAACGSVSYFCNHCNELVSRSQMLKEEDIKTEEISNNNDNL